MSNHSENTKRIAKNTMMLYCRMLFSMLVSLYTSRVVLNTLGVEDYGIYNVVGGFVAMFSLISSSLSSSVGRFLTFELGRGDMERLKRTFSTSLLIHVVLAIIIFVLMETIGVWFLNNKMTIPVERLYAANWVFQASILSFMLGLLSVPYNASIVSHERMSAFAYIGILDVILRLLIVLFIAYSSWHFDRLIVYALLLVAVGILMQSIYWRYCRKHFDECRFKLSFDREYWKEMSSFACWNFIGCSALLLKNQGVNILLNLFYGLTLNAARGIAESVSTVVNSFVSNFTTALNPQITKSYAGGDTSYSISLVEQGARFSFYVLLFFVIPIVLETRVILNLWLGDYPVYTVRFVRLILVFSLIDSLAKTLITLQNATGKIKKYQLIVGGILLLNFPLSYICLYLGFSPESTYWVAIVVTMLCLIARLFIAKEYVGLCIKHFIHKVILNVLLVAVIASILPIFFHIIIPFGWIRFVFVGIVSVLSTVFTILFLGCCKSEREYIIQNVFNKVRCLN